MAFLFRKFQEAVNTLAKSPTFARDPRVLQFEADVNRLFLYTSYFRLGKNAEEEDAEEIIEMASKASVAHQQIQVQENIHFQVKNIAQAMDDILRPDKDFSTTGASESQAHPRRSGLSLAVGGATPLINYPVVAPTQPLTRLELSENLKNHIGYTVDVRQSQIPHSEAGKGLFLSGEADIGSVVAFYPGVVYSPAFYKYIPGYPRIDACNSYLITRYDNLVINAQPWGLGGETRDIWDGFEIPNYSSSDVLKDQESHSDRLWRLLSKHSEKILPGSFGEVLERRNPLASGHFANHPPGGSEPNVMICPYDFPLTEKEMRVYIPNIMFGGQQPITMKRFGSFWFKTRGSSQQGDCSVIKTLVLVTTRAVCDEELYLNYRLSNSKRRPEWYSPVDEEEDKRRWG